MSYLSQPIPEIRPVRTVRVNDKAAFPEGTTYIIWGVGEVSKNTSGNFFWDNSAKGLDTEAIPKNEAALWVDEFQRGQNNGGYANWLFTGSDKDPVYVLGLNEPDLDTIRVRAPQTKFVVKQPNLNYFVPIMKVQQIRKGKEISFDIENGELLHLVLSASQFEKVLSEAKRFESEAESDMAGRVMQIVVDTKAKSKSDIYKFVANSRIYKYDEFPELHKQFANERVEILNRIDAQIKDVHGGIWGHGETADRSAQQVWMYLLEKSGLSIEQFTKKYFSGSESRLIDAEGESGLELDNFAIDDDE